MSAFRQRSPSDIPAALALASMSAGVSNSSCMTPSYLQKSIPVNSVLAQRLKRLRCAHMLGGMDDDRQLLRDYLKRAAEAAGTDLTGLARKAGLSPSTLTRFVNSDDKHLPTTRTLAKIAEASGLAPPTGGRQHMTKAERIQLLASVADALDVGLGEAAALVGSDVDGGRALEWLNLIAKLPAATEHNVFQMLRGMSDSSAPPKQDTDPSQAFRGRRRPKLASQQIE